MFVLCNAGDDDRTKAVGESLQGSLYGRFFGPPGHVAEGLAWLEEIGVSHAQLSPTDEGSFDRLAPLLPNCVIVSWLEPRARESIADYAQRIAETIPASDCFIGGVSLLAGCCPCSLVVDILFP